MKSRAAMRARVVRTHVTAASVTSWRYRLDFAASRIGKETDAQMSPASISPLASSAVTPHSLSPRRIAQSSAEGPRSPRMPGWITIQRCFRQTDSGIARLR